MGNDQDALAVRLRSNGAASLGGLRSRRTAQCQDGMRLMGAEEMQETGEESQWESAVATFLPRCSEETPAICLT